MVARTWLQWWWKKDIDSDDTGMNINMMESIRSDQDVQIDESETNSAKSKHGLMKIWWQTSDSHNEQDDDDGFVMFQPNKGEIYAS